MMSTEWLQPIRLAPASTKASNWAFVWIPPAAFTPISGPDGLPHQGDIFWQSPAFSESSGGFDEVGAGFLAAKQQAAISSFGEIAILENHFQGLRARPLS
jgi:hypothetical protein